MAVVTQIVLLLFMVDVGTYNQQVFDHVAEILNVENRE